MRFKLISLRINYISYASRLVKRVDRGTGRPYNRIIVIEFDERPKKTGTERFFKACAYLERFIEQFPGVEVKGLVAGSSPKIFIFLPESVNENNFFSVLAGLFQSKAVTDDIGRVSVRLEDTSGEEYVVTQARATIAEYLRNLYREIDGYQINEGQNRPATAAEKESIRKAVNYISRYYAAHAEKRDELDVLVEGIEQLLKLRQNPASILALIVLVMKMTANEKRRFISSVVVTPDCNPNEAFHLIDLTEELDKVDCHLSSEDLKNSQKADKLKMYLISKSMDLARKKMSGILSRPAEEDVKKMAYRVLMLSIVRRHVTVASIRNEEEKRKTAERVYYVDALIARDLNMEEFQYELRSKVFEITHSDKVRLIEGEIRRRFQGRSRKDLDRAVQDLKGIFEDEFLQHIVGEIIEEVDAFLQSKGQAVTDHRYIGIIKKFAIEFYSAGAPVDSPEFNHKVDEMKRRLNLVLRLTNSELLELLASIKILLGDRKMPEVQVRLKTLHSIYEKARRLKYDRLKKEYESQARKVKGSKAQIPPFSIGFDEVELTDKDIIGAISFDPSDDDKNLIAQFKSVRDDKIFDTAAFRFIVETPEERPRVLGCLEGLGPILEEEVINNSRGYRAVHVKLFDRLFFNEVVEIQIRDREAHIQAEEGDAQHRFYKGGEQLPALDPYATFGILVDRMKNFKFVPVEIHYYTKNVKSVTVLVSRDFVVLEKVANEFDLLVQGGYYMSCINESDVRAEEDRKTIVKVREGHVRTYYERLASKVETLRSRVKIKIALAIEKDIADYTQKQSSMRKAYEPFHDKLAILAADFNLEDLDMLFGGMAIDFVFKDRVDRYLDIKPDVDIKRIRKVVGREREVEISTRVEISVPNRVGLLRFWTDVLHGMGFNLIEECNCGVGDNGKFQMVFQFKGNLRDDISSSVKTLLERATDFYRATSQETEETREVEMAIVMDNGLLNIVRLAGLFKARGINIFTFQLEGKDRESRGLSFAVKLRVPLKQYKQLYRIEQELRAVPSVRKLTYAVSS